MEGTHVCSFPFVTQNWKSIQLLTGFEVKSNFVGSVARSRRLRGSNKIAIVLEPSLYTFIFFFQNCLIPLTNKNSFHSRSSSLRIWKTSLLLTLTLWRQNDVTYEPMKIRSSVACNRSINCWPVNRIMIQRMGFLG